MSRLLRAWKKIGEVAIYRDPDWDEYIVVPPGTGRPREGGESHPKWYHTDDKEDAIDTAKVISEHHMGRPYSLTRSSDAGWTRKNPKVRPELINHWVKLTGIEKRKLKKMADMAVELTRVASRHGEGGPLYAGQQYASYLPGLPYARGARVRHFGEFLLAWGTPRKNPAVGVPPRDVITREDYPAIFTDYDGDTVGDADDPHPFIPGDTEGIEEVRLADEIGTLIDTRQDYVEVKKAMMAFLKEMGGPQSKVLGRVKSPFSMINKLRRKRLGSLTDIAATMVVLPDYEKVLEVVTGIEGSGAKVLDVDDYYANPNQGYRAFHFILELDGMPVEVQVKTARMKEIGDASHHPYKVGRLNAQMMDELTSFAHQADQGDRAVAADLDKILSDPAALEEMLTK